MGTNTRALTLDELKSINDKYVFELKDDIVLVSTVGYNRKAVHNTNESFNINVKGIRVIRFLSNVMKMWARDYINDYTLVEVQAAVNKLTVTYQELTKENLDKELQETHEKIK